jgi:hypothetical protein
MPTLLARLRRRPAPRTRVRAARHDILSDMTAAESSDLASLGAAIERPDTTRLDLRSEVGRLGELAQWLAGVLGRPPRGLDRVRVVSFGSPEDEPLVASPGTRVVPTPELAVDLDSLRAAISQGVAAANDEIDAGADLLIAALPSTPATRTAALATVSICTNTEPAKVMGRGSSATRPAEWMAETVAVRDLRRAAFDQRGNPAALFTALGAPALASAAGFVVQAAARRTGVVLDGFEVTAAALVGYETAPGAVRWWLAADSGDAAQHPAYALAHVRLGLEPALGLGLDLSDGTAGLLCLPLLQAARTLI